LLDKISINIYAGYSCRKMKKNIKKVQSEIKKLLQSPHKEFELPILSAGGRKITVFHLRGKGKNGNYKKMLLIGGVHGDEIEGIFLVEKYLEKLKQTLCPEGLDILIIPIFNPDGHKKNQRKNHNSIDLNRNLPTSDWTNKSDEEKYYPGESAASEPESLLMVAIIDEFMPDIIISCHSWKPMLNYNGPSKKLAEEMSRANGYPVVDNVGYPTPGALGTYAGREKQIPTITFEVERKIDPEKNLQLNIPAIDNAIYYLLHKYKKRGDK
jgi:protein MpaA